MSAARWAACMRLDMVRIAALFPSSKTQNRASTLQQQMKVSGSAALLKAAPAFEGPHAC